MMKTKNIMNTTRRILALALLVLIVKTIAAIRQLIDNKNIWLYTDILDITPEAVYLSKEDVDALYVFDYLHTSENKNKYRTNTNEFAGDVRRVLNAETYSIAIKRVLTANEDNVSLRLKHLNQELSSEFQSFNNPRPVVLGHGLFGNLFSMESLGKKIATDKKYNKKYIRDVWLMEYSGGPNTDCDSCPNYDYDDLVDWYWPALIGGVLKYSGENSTDYVGYSSGGGVGIRSYEKYYLGNSSTMGYYVNDSDDWEGFSLPANFVDHMALIAPMGAFDEETFVTRCVDEYGNLANNDLSKYNHINREMIAKKISIYSALDSSPVIGGSIGMKTTCSLGLGLLMFPETKKISYNFWEDITESIQNKTDINPKLSSINQILLIKGIGFNDDFVVPNEDINYIYDNSNANKKYKATVLWPHAGMPDAPVGTYDPLISKFLNDKPYTIWEKNWIYFIDSG